MKIKNPEKWKVAELSDLIIKENHIQLKSNQLKKSMTGDKESLENSGKSSKEGSITELAS